MSREVYKKIAVIMTISLSVLIYGKRSFAADIPVVPAPEKIETQDGEFAFENGMNIYCDARLKSVCEWFSALYPAYSFRIVEQSVSGNGGISILINDSTGDGRGDDAYRIESNNERIMIQAGAPAGAFYALQTLRQLTPPDAEGARGSSVAVKIPAMAIDDAPRFAWRGLMLDVARHFLPKEFVFKLIDQMAALKLNKLHLHLTDDQGWRMEILKYPALTEIGAWRLKSSPKDEMSFSPTGPAHGGFYTQDDIREIVAYGQSRFVEIVPEIDMPGHIQSALASVHGLACEDRKYKVRTQWGVNPEILCAGNDAGLEFMRNVLSEVSELFPSGFVHIGGDEVPKSNWKKCPKCQARIKELELKDEEELQGWFMKQAGDYLASKGKRMIGWDEILAGGLPDRAVVMSWRGMEGGIAAAMSGHDVVMSPTSHCYLDYKESANEPKGMGAPYAEPTPMCEVYGFEPVPPQLQGSDIQRILGAQGNLWTEFVVDENGAEYMYFPRAAALAEVVWSPREKRDWTGFEKRMESYYKRLDAAGINYRRPRDSDESLCDSK